MFRKGCIPIFYGHAASIMRNRGIWFDWNGYPVMPTFHPAFLLRQTGRQLVEAKWQVYYDFKAAVEKAVAQEPDYTYKSNEKPNLLAQYEELKNSGLYKPNSPVYQKYLAYLDKILFRSITGTRLPPLYTPLFPHRPRIQVSLLPRKGF